MSIKGLANLERKLKRLRDINAKPIIEDASARVRDEARKNVVVDTGELQNSIRYRIEDKRNGNYRGIVYTNKEHGIFVEFGTGPVGEANHQGISPNITPMYRSDGWVYKTKENNMSAIFASSGKVNKSATKRMNKSGGQFVFTMGQPAKPFMYPALHDNREKIKKFIKYRMKKELKEASK